MTDTVPDPSVSRQGSNIQRRRGRPRIEHGDQLEDLKSVAGLPRKVQALVLGGKLKVTVPYRIDLLAQGQMVMDSMQTSADEVVDLSRRFYAKDPHDTTIICPDCNAWTRPSRFDSRTMAGEYRCRNGHEWITEFPGGSTPPRHRETTRLPYKLGGPIHEDEKVRYAQTLLRHLPPAGPDSAPEVNQLRALLENAQQTLKRHERRARELGLDIDPEKARA